MKNLHRSYSFSESKVKYSETPEMKEKKRKASIKEGKQPITP